MNKLTIPIAKYDFSFIDDPYLRPALVIYCCGCPHNCPNCQNKELQKVTSEYCTQVQVGQVCNYIKKLDKKMVESVVYLGGDFGIYREQYYLISKAAKERGLHNILYTGFRFEGLDNKFKTYTDMIIDGRYDENLKQDIFPASENQRVWEKVFNTWLIVNPIILPINVSKLD